METTRDNHDTVTVAATPKSHASRLQKKRVRRDSSSEPQDVGCCPCESSDRLVCDFWSGSFPSVCLLAGHVGFTPRYRTSSWSRRNRCTETMPPSLRTNRPTEPLDVFPSLRARRCSLREGHDAADIVLQLDALARLRLSVPGNLAPNRYSMTPNQLGSSALPI